MGRRAIDPLPTNQTAELDLGEMYKPWKYVDVYIPTVLQSIVGMLGDLNVS